MQGKAGEVTDYQIDLPGGIYRVEVRAEGFKRYENSVRVLPGGNLSYEFFLELSEPGERGDEEEDDSELLEGRFTWFAQQRMSGTKKKVRDLRKAEFPAGARLDALEQKSRMNDVEALNHGLEIEGLKDPLPKSSFGTFGAFVRVTQKGAGIEFRRSRLTIAYDPRKLGWVDERTLRVFELDAKKKQFRLISDSGADLQRHQAFAYIAKPGTYGVIGLPKHPAVLETVRLFCRLNDQLREEALRGIDALKNRICQVILCAGGLDKAGGPELPGGAGGNICDYCTGIDIPPGGLPECELLDAPAGPVVTPGCNWVCIGPRNINGRVRALANHPTDGATVYAGSATAGVWVTRDSGESWTPLMHDQGALEIGALATHLTDPANPMGNVTIYAGTGEPTSWPGYRGIGVLKSTDSGNTWTLTAAIGNDRFSAILIDPTTVTSNPSSTTLYAGGTPGGLYKSTDGGGTWTLILSKNITGLAMDPANSGVIYAAVAFEGVYKYDPMTNTWSTFNAGFAVGIPQLCLIAIGQAAPHTMYAKLDQTVYKYDTASSNWVSLGNHGSTTYGYWNNVLAIDPQDSNIVFAGGIGFERTYDGGTTWQIVGGLHSDQHAFTFSATTHLTVYAGNDGGVYRGIYASPSDAGTWTKESDGLILTQFNQIGTSPAGTDVLGGGCQDNGTNRTVGGLTYDNIYGADGGFLVYDPANPYILYAEIQSGGGLGRSTNGGASWTSAGGGFPGGPWVTPVVLDANSPADPNRVLFAGGNSQVYRSTNSGGSWSPSSPNVSGSVIAIALAPSSSALVYAGSSSGTVWRSPDNGATLANWKDITTGTLGGGATLPPRSVTDVAAHPTDPDTVFVTFSGFGSSTPTMPGHIFKATSGDGFVTWAWVDVSSNLPDIPLNAIVVDPSSPSTIYVGTDVGVFRTTDGGISWSEFGNGLPNVVVADLVLNATGNKLRAATYGYGMWEIELGTPCSDVDVYIRDNKLDAGEAIPSPSGVPDPTILGTNVYWWESSDIKVDAFPYRPPDPLFDGVEFDLATPEDPVRNDALHPNANHLYVQAHNRGPLSAHNVKVKVLYADASAGLPALPADFWSSFPNDWSAASSWNTVDATVPFQSIPELLPHTPKVLSWNWTVPPSANDHTCMLAVISADEDPVVRSDANPNDHLLWMIVPYDKHIALRNLHVITAAAPGGIPGAHFVDFHNAQRFAQYFDLVLDISNLPKDTRLSLLLPKVFLQSPRPAEGNNVRLLEVGKQAWWHKAKTLSKGKWHYEVQIHGSCVDPCSGRRLAVVPRLLIPAGERIRTALVVTPPPKAPPGSVYRFALLQKQGSITIGGSTYEMRIPPARVRMGRR